MLKPCCAGGVGSKKGCHMKSGKQITQYLEEVAQVLLDLGVTTSFHMLVAGGAYMLLLNERKFTRDIDFALVELASPKIALHTILRVRIQRAEISGKASSVPYSAEFKQAVEIVAQRHRGLTADWLNDEAAVYYYDDAPVAEATFWRSFVDILFVYLPTMEYMLATKLAAYRPKDLNDIRVLLRALNIHTREQAKAIVDTFLLPDAQEFWEVDKKLRRLFP